MKGNEKLASLIVYANSLRQRLSNPPPEKHNKTPESRAAFKQFIEIDLRKTEAQIAKLKG